MRIATVEQVAAIAEQVPPRYRALVLVTAFSGLRWGELAGLRRKHIDLEAGRVTVAEQLVEVNGVFSFGPPKSAAGRRTVTLPAVVVEALAEHLAHYTAKSPEAFVFLGSQGKHLRRSNFNRRVCSRPPERLASRGSVYMTCATLPVRSPPPPAAPYAKSCTGWATPPRSRPCYQHVMAERDAAIARELNRLIERG